MRHFDEKYYLTRFNYAKLILPHFFAMMSGYNLVMEYV